MLNMQQSIVEKSNNQQEERKKGREKGKAGESKIKNEMTSELYGDIL